MLSYVSICHNPCCILHAENAAGSKQPQLSRCHAQISWPEALSIESMADTRELAVHLYMSMDTTYILIVDGGTFPTFPAHMQL